MRNVENSKNLNLFTAQRATVLDKLLLLVEVSKVLFNKRLSQASCFLYEICSSESITFFKTASKFCHTILTGHTLFPPTVFDIEPLKPLFIFTSPDLPSSPINGV